MAAEKEIQDFFEKVQAVASIAYHSVMQDGSVAAVGREAVNDARSKLFEVFFGQGERGVEPGTPMSPLFSDLADTRQEHSEAIDAAMVTLFPPSPGDLAEGKGLAAEPAGQKLPSPGDLAEGNYTPSQQPEAQRQNQKHGIGV